MVQRFNLKELEEEERERTSPNGSFRLRYFDTGKRRHVPNSDSSRRRLKSNESYMLRTERVHTMSQFISNELNRQDLISKEMGFDFTEVKIKDDVLLLNWILHFAGQLLNKLRFGFLQPKVQFGKKIWLQKIGEEGINSTLKRRIQGTFVGHQDRKRTIWYIAKNGGVRGHSWIRQTLSDARESMHLEDWVGDPGHMMTGSHIMITKWARYHQTVIAELKLTKKGTTDEEGTKLMMPRIVVDVSRYREVERRRFYIMSTDIEAPGHMGSCPGYALLTSQGRSGWIPGANRNGAGGGSTCGRIWRSHHREPTRKEGKERHPSEWCCESIEQAMFDDT